MPTLPRRKYFILGAGASTEYGYPTSEQLYQLISGTTNIPLLGICRPKAMAVVDEIIGKGTFESFASQVKKASFASIDDFLDMRKDFSDMGRYVLASIIMCLEKEDALYRPNATFYKKFFNEILWPSFISETPDPIALATFNYDRSFEAFVLNALLTRGQREEKIIEFFKKFPIHHFHGMIGGNEWLFKANYGKIDINAPNLITAQATIRFQFENKNKMTENMVMNDDDVYLIGFGFHENNLEKLHSKPWKNSTKVYATTLGISEKKLHAINLGWFNLILNNRRRDVIRSGTELINEFLG